MSDNLTIRDEKKTIFYCKTYPNVTFNTNIRFNEWQYEAVSFILKFT
jgi:hypothetical protein